MPVVYDNQFSNAGNSASPNCSITVASAINRLLLVGLESLNGAGVSSPNYGGTPLTLIAQLSDTFFYYLVAPAVGTANAGMTLSIGQDYCIGAMLFSGVDQAAPIGTPQTATNNELTSISQSVIGTSDGLIADMCFMVNDSMSAAVGQTRRVSRDGYAGFRSLGMSTKASIAGSVSMQWDAPATFGDNALIVVPLRASAGAGGSASTSWIRA